MNNRWFDGLRDRSPDPQPERQDMSIEANIRAALSGVELTPGAELPLVRLLTEDLKGVDGSLIGQAVQTRLKGEYSVFLKQAPAHPVAAFAAEGHRISEGGGFIGSDPYVGKYDPALQHNPAAPQIGTAASRAQHQGVNPANTAGDNPHPFGSLDWHAWNVKKSKQNLSGFKLVNPR